MEIWKTVEASHRCETSNEICPLCEMAEVRWCKGPNSASNYGAWAAYIFQAKVCAVHSVFTWTLPEQLAFSSTLFYFLWLCEISIVCVELWVWQAGTDTQTLPLFWQVDSGFKFNICNWCWCCKSIHISSAIFKIVFILNTKTDP